MNEQDLRDCFAMFIVMGIVVHEGVLDDRMPHRAYLMADLMLEARNKTSEQEVGITTVKPRKRTSK